MYDFLIKEFISRMTFKDINNFAEKEGITLEKNETELIYNYIKKDYLTLLHGNPRSILDEIKDKVRPNVYNKIEQLYIQFKNKIST